MNVRHLDKLLILEIFENTAQRLCAIGSSEHKGVDANRNDSGLTIGVGLGLPCQSTYIIDPQLLNIPWLFQALQILPMSTVTAG